MENNVIQSIFTSADFKEEDRKRIIESFKPIHFKKSEYILNEGITASHYWFLDSGYARSFAIDTEGNDITTQFFGPGEIVINWTSFFLRKPSREFIQALSDCEAWQLDYEQFQSLFHSIEAFRESGRGRLVQSYFELKNHSLGQITRSAKDRYLSLLEEKPQLLQNVSLKQIASFLGITDTSLSRIRNEITHE